MGDTYVGGTTWGESEFEPNEIYFAKCGANMQAMLQSWALQEYRSTQDVYLHERAAGRCDLDGASTMSQQIAQARADGFKINSHGLDESWEADGKDGWKAWFLSALPDAAVGIEIAHGQKLRDELTGLGEDANNLAYHFIALFGYHPGGVTDHPYARGKTLPEGWWASDGDSYVNNTKTGSGWNRHKGGHNLCFYSHETLKAAKPVAALAMFPKVTITGGSMPIPTGWKDDGKTLTAKNGITVLTAKRDVILNADHWDEDNVPLTAAVPAADLVESDPKIGAGNVQFFRDGWMLWPNAQATVMQTEIGQEFLLVRSQRDEARAKLATAQQTITQLQQQLAAAQNGQSGDGQSPPPVNQDALDALAAVTSLGQLVALAQRLGGAR